MAQDQGSKGLVLHPVVLTISSLDVLPSSVSDTLANEATSLIFVFGEVETKYALDENQQEVLAKLRNGHIQSPAYRL